MGHDIICTERVIIAIIAYLISEQGLTILDFLSVFGPYTVFDFINRLLFLFY